MEKNQKNALAYLSGGLAIVAVLGGIFNLYPLLYGLLGALVLVVISGAIKRSWTATLGCIGLIVLVAGIFGVYAFVYGLLGAVILWVVSGSLKRYLGEVNGGNSLP
ncbi:MAG: hypothetical protein ACXVH2_09710 [Methanobacterium sp.]